MLKTASFVAAAVIALPSAVCGQAPSDAEFALYVANDVKSDCLKARSQAPNAAFAHHLDRLCGCIHAKIAATPMDRGDNDDTVNLKVHAAMNQCAAKLGGTPDVEDYRAVGMKPSAH